MMNQGSCRNTWSFSIVSFKSRLIFLYFAIMEVLISVVVILLVKEMVSRRLFHGRNY